MPHATFADDLTPSPHWCTRLSPATLTIDCVGRLAGAPKKTMDKLQHVLNAAACVVSNRSKYDRGLTQF